MTINAEGGSSILGGFRDDFKALSTKQIIAIIAAIALSLILVVLGLGRSCLGFLIIAVILYMIPHMMGVMSAKVKAVVGVVFVVFAILVGTFAYSTDISDQTDISNGNAIANEAITYDESTGTYYLTFSVNPVAAGIATDSEGAISGSWGVRVGYGETSRLSFGAITATTGGTTLSYMSTDAVSVSDGWYTFKVELTNMHQGVIEYLEFTVDRVSDSGTRTLLENGKMSYDTGISSGDCRMLMLRGSAVTAAQIALLFFIILGFATVMRRSATKSREKMEAEGRLYPQGYGRCKECGAMVLPGEVVCRKCGAYIDVPEEMRPKKKDYVTCSECGAEVPADADTCPRCGARFDEEEVVEVSHVDGTVEETSDTVPCPHCGESIPANAGWCPKCGKKVRE